MFAEKKKEPLRIENIKRDLFEIEKAKLQILLHWRLYSSALPFGLLTLLLYLMAVLIPDLPEAKIYNMGAVIGAIICAIFMIYNLVILLDHIFVERKKELMRIETADFTVSDDVLESIEEACMYEPHVGYPRGHSYKFVYFFCFSDSRCRLYRLKKHYAWSKDVYRTNAGMEQTSLIGDEFYTVKFNGDDKIAYFYNRKFFELK